MTVPDVDTPISAMGESWTFAPAPPEATIVLDRHESDELTAGLAPLPSRLAGRELDDPVLLTEVELASRGLPRRLLSCLIDFRISGNPYGMLLIRGLPVEQPLPDTPSADGQGPHWSALATSALTQLAVMSVLGDVIAYADEKKGRLIQDICPVPGAESYQENTGSSLLELHTEDGFHPFKPELISLYCLRGDHQLRANTVTASIRSVLDSLPDGCLGTLREPLFRIRFASSFVGHGGPPRYSAMLPVLSGPLGDPDLCVDFHAMEPTTQDAAQAFALLRKAMSGALVGVVLEPGDMIVVDNRVAVHGRTGFTSCYDGEDRWLRRCFTVADLRRSRGWREPDSRVCIPIS